MTLQYGLGPPTGGWFFDMSTVTQELETQPYFYGATLWQTPVEQRVVQRSIKRGIDIVVALFAVLVLAIPFVLICVAIKIDSRGPVIFRQRRVNKHGGTFWFHKFRTMREDAEALRLYLEVQNEHQGPIFKMRNDPRRTRLGRVLRKTSLDELPNLFDVLAGSMSLVGPRPALPEEVTTYDRWELRRVSVKPGITGLWQVSGRSLLTWGEMVQLDIRYIETWSIWKDVVILLRTIPAVILGRGAY